MPLGGPQSCLYDADRGDLLDNFHSRVVFSFSNKSIRFDKADKRCSHFVPQEMENVLATTSASATPPGRVEHAAFLIAVL